MSRHGPEALARRALTLLGCGLAVLTLFAMLTYRAGGPRWPHIVVDGSAWGLVLVTTAMLLIASVEKLAMLVARRSAR